MSLITTGVLVIESSLLVGVGVVGATGEIVSETVVGEAVGFLVGEIVVGGVFWVVLVADWALSPSN